MDDIQFKIFCQKVDMLALSLTTAMLMMGSGASLEDAIKRARRIVFDADTSAQAGNF